MEKQVTVSGKEYLVVKSETDITRVYRVKQDGSRGAELKQGHKAAYQAKFAIREWAFAK